ncbi:MAG: hypothetical protein FD146_1604 [Anaerolineaceae bacterium]|nr:MAG: hypothetical protein FD146_1604 [Anaerolineaceae bacterium]
MNYGEIFVKAAKITWKHKVLWLPAMFLSIFTIAYSVGTTWWSESMTAMSTELQQNPERMPSSFLSSMGLFFLFAILMMIISSVLGVFNTIIVSRGAFKAEQGEERLTIAGLIRDSLPFFWRVFGMSLFMGLALMIAMIPIVCFLWVAVFSIALSSIQTTGTTTGLWLAYIPMLLCVIPVVLAYTGFAEQTFLAIIVENDSFGNALSRGWNIFRRNLGVNFLMAFLLGLLTWIVSYLVALPMQPLATRLLFTGGNSDILTTLLYLGLSLIYVAVFVIVQGVISAFYQSAWTLTFLRLTKPSVLSEPAPAENV